MRKPWNKRVRQIHTSYLSRAHEWGLCKFFLAGVNFYRFNAKNWQFTVYLGNLLCKLAIYCVNFGINLILQNFCLCKKMTNMRYDYHYVSSTAKKHENYVETFGHIICRGALKTTWSRLWNNFGTTLRKLWDSLGTNLVQLWNTFGTPLRHIWDNLRITLWLKSEYWWSEPLPCALWAAYDHFHGAECWVTNWMKI